MSAPREPWKRFADMQVEALVNLKEYTPEEWAAAEAYAREQMASAQSEADQEAATKEYNRE